MKTNAHFFTLAALLAANTGFSENLNISDENSHTVSGSENYQKFSISQGASGQTAELIMTGGSEIVFDGDAGDSNLGRTGGSDAYGGLAKIGISGDGNTFVMGSKTAPKGAMFFGDQMAAGSAEFVVTGSNTELYIGALVMGRGIAAGVSNLFSISGSNISYNHTTHRGYFDIGWNGNGNGRNAVYTKGDAADSRVYMNMKYVGDGTNVNIYGGASNSAANSFVMDGNVTLSQNAGVGAVTVNVNGGQQYGNAAFEVNNSGNIALINQLVVGNANQASGSASVFRISGSGSTIQVATANFRGASGTSASDIRGAVLEFSIDSGSVSTLNVSSLNEFSGVLVLDFSGFSGALEQSYTYNLISAGNNWENIWNAFGWDNDTQTSSSDRILIKGANGGVRLNYDAGSLSAVYTAVPEPGTCAALFGALALALAALRRRSDA